MGHLSRFLDRVIADRKFSFEDVVLGYHPTPCPEPTPAEAGTADVLAWEHDSADNDLGSYPGPGWQDDEGYAPTEEEEAEALGYAWGWDGEPRPDACDLSVPTAIFDARVRGWVAGHARRGYHDELARLEAIDEDLARDAWLEEMDERDAMAERYAAPWHLMNEAELVESMGVVEMRRIEP